MDPVLENLFSSIKQKQSAPIRTRYSGIPLRQAEPPHGSRDLRPQTQDTDAFEMLSQRFSNNQITLQDAWKSCKTLLSTQAQSGVTPGRTLDQKNPLFRDLLIAITRHHIPPDRNDSLPSPSQVIIEYCERGVQNFWWNDVLWIYLAEIIKILHQSNGVRSISDVRTSDEKITWLMGKVIHVWSAFRGRYGALSARLKDKQDRLPSQVESAKAYFKLLFPKYPNSHTPDDIMAACKLTHQCLKETIDSRKLAVHTTLDGQAFISSLNQLVEGRTFPPDPAKVSLAYQGISRPLIDSWVQYSSGWGDKPVKHEKVSLSAQAPTEAIQTMDRQPEEPSQANYIITTLQRQEQPLASSARLTQSSIKNARQNILQSDGEAPWDKARIYRAATTIIKDLENAVERSDVARAASIWQRYEQRLSSLDLEPKSREEVYIHFLSSFFALSRQEQAVHIWNHMLETGILPNQRHWNAMLSGSSKARDIISLEEIWTNMITTGIEPDIMSWTTYIHGLIMCRKCERGLQALNDLGRRWEQVQIDLKAKAASIDKPAVRSHVIPSEHDANKPSLIPVQAAASALIRIGNYELCNPLIDWAKAHSIALTTEFFNILLRPAVRTSDTGRTRHLLSLMHANGCPADERTYTIILNAYMSNIDSNFPALSPQEQQESVIHILDEMTAKGIPIDQRTYGTILYGLLNPKSAVRNEQAARAVLDHMDKNGFKPSHYIYSILASHYFSLSPPDLQAVEHLWKRILLERPILDREFYEKMVEGYATARLVERMLYFLRAIANEGQSPSWQCLLVVLNTLIETGEWGLVKELVEDVKDRHGGLRRFADEGRKGGWVEQEFWTTAEDVSDRMEEAP